MREMPFVNVHDALAAVDFDNRRDQRDDAVANIFYVRTFIHGEPIRQLHQRCWRACFRR